MNYSNFIVVQKNLSIGVTTLLLVLLVSCETKTKPISEENIFENTRVEEDIKAYWYSGLAEITSYELTQQRYGEERNGRAVLIYVTEDIDHQQLVKVDQKKEGNFPVLKLNTTKSFTTGIYPYHIMQSSFLPMENNHRVAKISASIQEWCGQSFMMLEQKDQLEIQVNSYFQKIGNQHKTVQNVSTENGIWNKLRLFPTQIDTSITSMLPSFEYLRLYNTEVKAYPVIISQEEQSGILKTSLVYPDLHRDLKITQETTPPYTILGWEESITRNDSTYTTKAKKIAQMRIDYWNKSQEKHSFLRDSLKL